MPAEYIIALPVITLVVWLYMTGWFVVALLKNRNDVADIAWGLGFFVATFAGLAQSFNPTRSGLLVLMMVLVWGSRLSLHIYRRNHSKPEDYRYAQWRHDWGKWFYIRSYFQVFMLQGVLLLFVATPALVVVTSSSEVMEWFLIIGFLIWLFGFVFESVADRQLRNFVSDHHNRGKLMTRGLWSYSRHPNYFGEITQWWGLGVVSLGVANGAIGLLGPALITYLIVKVSGIPLLEEKYKHNTDYQAYKRRTSSLIPLPPRRT